MKIERSEEWWMARARLDGDMVVSAGPATPPPPSAQFQSAQCAPALNPEHSEAVARKPTALNPNDKPRWLGRFRTNVDPRRQAARRFDLFAAA